MLSTLEAPFLQLCQLPTLNNKATSSIKPIIFVEIKKQTNATRMLIENPVRVANTHTHKCTVHMAP